jgi:hypothetical protein
MKPGNEFRQLIADAMQSRGRSRYWLACAVENDPAAGASRGAVYRYLRGDGDAGGALIAACLRALDIAWPNSSELARGQEPCERSKTPI